MFAGIHRIEANPGYTFAAKGLDQAVGCHHLTCDRPCGVTAGNLPDIEDQWGYSRCSSTTAPMGGWAPGSEQWEYVRLNCEHACQMSRKCIDGQRTLHENCRRRRRLRQRVNVD